MTDFLTLLITTRCNYKCRHCLREYPAIHHDLPLALVNKAITEAREMGFKHIAITGGEPVLHPRFNDIIALIAGMGFQWSIVSNGSLYKEYDAAIDNYKDKLKIFLISIDGGTEVTHDAIRQKGSFRKVCEAARYYKVKGIFVMLIYTLTALNFNEVPQFVQISLDLKVDGIKVAATIPTGYNKDLQVSWLQKVLVYQYLQGMRKENLPLVISNTTSLYTVKDADKFCSNINEHDPVINAYGDYVFCCDTIGQGAVLGSLKKEKFSQLYIKGQETGAWIREERRKRILNKDFFKDFNSCHFCNLLLADKVKKQKEYCRENQLISNEDKI